MLWRLHIRPTPRNGRTHQDVVNYCLQHNVAGMGWPVKVSVTNAYEYELAARAQYSGRRVPSIRFAYDPSPGQYIWARDLGGNYLLGCITGDWFYSNNPIHLELDIPNQRPCEWVEIGSEENVPGKIIACFRPAKTLQAIHDSMMEDFSKWIFSSKSGHESPKTSSLVTPVTEKTFFSLIG